jgi:hypothetical protein
LTRFFKIHIFGVSNAMRYYDTFFRKQRDPTNMGGFAHQMVASSFARGGSTETQDAQQRPITPGFANTSLE